ncbi:MAG TPA: transcriptional regulator [Alphaproteobacteria bacterium]|nr:transcriptional regulator [Alphaproteobacteria bacterium]
MRTVILGIETQNDVTRRILATARGRREAGDDRISFESVHDLWRVLAPKRMDIVRIMTGAGPLTIREVARRVGRDFKAVHSDVTLLANAGIVERTESGAIEFPYDRVHVAFDVMVA